MQENLMKVHFFLALFHPRTLHGTKKGVLKDSTAEREGFEPPEPLSSTVFKTAAIDHSAISPLNSGSRSPRYFLG